MPIRGVSGRVSTPRGMKFRLGYKKHGAQYPSDADVFIGRKGADDGITEEVVAAYGATPVAGAEPGTFSFGPELRLMLYFEHDAINPQNGRELSVQLGNFAWAASKLRCTGDGGSADPDEVGVATCLDEGWAKRITAKTGEKPQAIPGAVRPAWQISCLGRHCPKFASNPDADEDAACRHTIRLQALLLHPELDPEAPNYMKVLGWMELVSGSWYGMAGVQNGFAAMKSLVGRTAHIPFYLKRQRQVLLRANAGSGDVKRVPKHLLRVDFDQDEVLRFGLASSMRALLRPAVRKQMLELERAEAEIKQIAGAEPSYSSFRDIDRPRQALPAARAAAAEAPTLPDNQPEPAPPSLPTDRDEAIETQRERSEATDADLNRLLTQQELDALKVLAGGMPGHPETLSRFRALALASYEEFGEECPMRDGVAKPYLGLRVRHAIWIREQLADDVPVVEGEVIEPAQSRR